VVRAVQPELQLTEVAPKLAVTPNTNSPGRLVVPVEPEEKEPLVPLAADAWSTAVAPATSSVVIR
jgi:hypothetical protein